MMVLSFNKKNLLIISFTLLLISTAGSTFAQGPSPQKKLEYAKGLWDKFRFDDMARSELERLTQSANTPQNIKKEAHKTLSKIYSDLSARETDPNKRENHLNKASEHLAKSGVAKNSLEYALLRFNMVKALVRALEQKKESGTLTPKQAKELKRKAISQSRDALSILKRISEAKKKEYEPMLDKFWKEMKKLRRNKEFMGKFNKVAGEYIRATLKWAELTIIIAEMYDKGEPQRYSGPRSLLDSLEDFRYNIDGLPFPMIESSILAARAKILLSEKKSGRWAEAMQDFDEALGVSSRGQSRDVAEMIRQAKLKAYLEKIKICVKYQKWADAERTALSFRKDFPRCKIKWLSYKMEIERAESVAHLADAGKNGYSLKAAMDILVALQRRVPKNNPWHRNIEDTIKTINELTGVDEVDDPEILFGMANSAYGDRDFAEAAELYKKCLAKQVSPGKGVKYRPEAWLRLGHCYYYSKPERLYEAAIAFGRCVEEFPPDKYARKKYPEVYNTTLDCAKKMRSMFSLRYKKSSLEFDKELETASLESLKIFPEASPYYYLGKSYLAKKKFTEAVKMFKKVKKTSDKYEASLYNVGYTYYMWGMDIKSDNANQHNQKSTELLDRAAGELNTFMSWIKKDKVVPDKATKERRQRYLSYAKLQLAIIAQDKGNTDKSIEMFTTYLKNAKSQENKVKVYQYLYKAYDTKENIDKLVEILTQLEKIDGQFFSGGPKHKDKLLQNAYLRLGAKMLKKSKELKEKDQAMSKELNKKGLWYLQKSLAFGDSDMPRSELFRLIAKNMYQMKEYETAFYYYNEYLKTLPKGEIPDKKDMESIWKQFTSDRNENFFKFWMDFLYDAPDAREKEPREEELKDYDRFIQFFEKKVSFAGTKYEKFKNMTPILELAEKEKDWKRCIGRLKKIVAGVKNLIDQIDTKTQMANCKMFSGDWDESIQLWKQINSHFPEIVSYEWNLARAYTRAAQNLGETNQPKASEYGIEAVKIWLDLENNLPEGNDTFKVKYERVDTDLLLGKIAVDKENREIFRKRGITTLRLLALNPDIYLKYGFDKLAKKYDLDIEVKKKDTTDKPETEKTGSDDTASAPAPETTKSEKSANEEKTTEKDSDAPAGKEEK